MFSHQLDLKSMFSSLTSFYLAASLHPRKTWLGKISDLVRISCSEVFQELYWRVRCSAHNEPWSLQVSQVKPREVPPPGAVPRLQPSAFIKINECLNNQWRGWVFNSCWCPTGGLFVVVCSKQNSSALAIEFDSDTEKLLLALFCVTFSQTERPFLCHCLPEHLLRHEQTFPHWNGGAQMTELLLCSPRHICWVCCHALSWLAITITLLRPEAALKLDLFIHFSFIHGLTSNTVTYVFYPCNNGLRVHPWIG